MEPAGRDEDGFAASLIHGKAALGSFRGPDVKWQIASFVSEIVLGAFRIKMPSFAAADVGAPAIGAKNVGVKWSLKKNFFT